jgi:Flp pilus assembly protein TadG
LCVHWRLFLQEKGNQASGMCRLRSQRRSRGAAAAEFALLLPLLCMLFLGTIDFCRVFYYSLTVHNCARNGAMYGGADAAHAVNGSGIVTAAKLDAVSLPNYAELMQVSSSTDSAISPTYVDVTVTYPFSTITRYPGIPRQVNLSRCVRMNVVPTTPSFN